MKTTSMRHWLAGMAALALTMTSCSDYEGGRHWYDSNITALVTVRPTEGGSFKMQLNDNTELIPSNLNESPFGPKEVRAIVNYTTDAGNERNVQSVRVNWMDSIRTKLPVPYVEDQNDRLYGNDPIEIVRDWVTVAEDGYLTLRIRTLWGDRGVKHHINLLTGMNADDAYEVELRHNAMGDVQGRPGDALIAFNLNGLPRDDKQKVKVRLHWTSFSGPKEAEFQLQLHPATDTQVVERMPLNSLVE
ncbi:MAG: NigD-like protein [Bacteroidaceae bacterium]